MLDLSIINCKICGTDFYGSVVQTVRDSIIKFFKNFILEGRLTYTKNIRGN